MSFYDLRLAFRHLWRKKIYALVIVLSLAVGFSCSGLLLSFIIRELSTDDFHAKVARTYQIFSADPFDDDGKIPYLPVSTGRYLQDHYPQVEHLTQVGTLGKIRLTTPRTTAEEADLLSVDSSFFSIFDFPLYAGTTRQALTPESIVISREIALLLFGNDRPLGEMITLQTADTSRVLFVTAVLDPAREKSHLAFEALVVHDVLKNAFHGGATYAVLRDASLHDNLVSRINQDRKVPGLQEEGKLKYDLQPLRHSWFSPFNKMTYMVTRSMTFVKTTVWVCGIVLFMAVFNFASLYLLSLQERKKDAGIRKTLGLSTGKLIHALTTEVLVYVAIALVVAVGLMKILLPFISNVLGTSLNLDQMIRMDLVAWAGAAILLLGVFVIGVSFVQQRRIPPVSLMKSGASRVVFNKTLFTVQFVVSITLSVCAVTFIRQMHYLETAPLGFNRDIMVLRVEQSQTGKLPVLKNELLGLPGVNNVAIANGSPIAGNWMARYELEDGTFYSPMLFSGDEDLVRTLDLELLEGKLPSATTSGRVVNETLVRMFDIKDPVGKMIPGTKDEIIGVVRNFTVTSFKDVIQPAIISYSTNNSRLLIDYSGASVASLIPAMQAAWRSIFPADRFSYHLIQDDLMKKYRDDTFLFRTVVTYAIVSMVISCFGLFALSWAVAQSKMKEIGVRKVLGAKAGDIVQLLSFSFMKRIVIAFVVAAPVSYYLMNGWLEGFVRRVDMDCFTFACAGVTVTTVAMVTMSMQTLRAAWRNPVEELRSE